MDILIKGILVLSFLTEYVDFWFDNIHLYAYQYKDQVTTKQIDPPVLFVGTGTDKCKDKVW